MLTLQTTTKFRKDYKRMKKQNKDMSLLQDVLDTLLAEKPLEDDFNDHPLKGNYMGFRECHIQPDWLLIYAIHKEQLVLVAARTGSHSELFNE
jgi:mRNA interferase YafQ